MLCGEEPRNSLIVPSYTILSWEHSVMSCFHCFKTINVSFDERIGGNLLSIIVSKRCFESRDDPRAALDA